MDSSTPGFGPLQDRISKALVSTTRTTAQLCAEDLAFHRSLDPELGTTLDRETERLLSLTKNLIRIAVAGSTDEDPVQLRDADDVENNWRGVVDVIDSLLEQADTCLDEYTGVIKRASPGQEEPRDKVAAPKQSKQKLSYALRNQNIAKPQWLFKSTATNDEISPFKPLLRSKPHAAVPLADSLNTFINEEGAELYKHPYEPEITQLEYPTFVFERADPVPYHDFDATTAVFVDTPEKVAAMLAELKKAKEIAIDLEHHDARSYVGLVSLMQISTRNQDWVVDTLKPWREDLQVLNEVFADPRILKVFHGAFMDMVWLQRDLGLYVVGLFDTYHACRALGYPHASLASLLARFVNIEADKQYQMADWRVRPLPRELFNYARSDTHYLLYIYDNLRNELIERSTTPTEEDTPLERVLKNSKETSLQLYERFIYDAESGKGASGWFRMLKRMPALFSREQFSVFRAVHQWRDNVARQNDDSLNYIMPNHVIFSISRAMPMDLTALHGVAHPISQPVRTRATELLSVIAKAKEAGVDGPNMVDVLAPLESASKNESTKATPIGTPAALSPAPLAVESQSVADAPPVRNDVSYFWGPSLERTLTRMQSVCLSIREGLRLALPLPQLTAEIFEEAANGVSDLQKSNDSTSPAVVVEHEYVRDRKPRAAEGDGVFVVKELGGGRKRKARDDEESVPDDDNGGDGSLEMDMNKIGSDEDEEAVRAREKAESKAQRKAQRKLEKEQRKKRKAEANGSGQQTHDTQDAEGGSEPFDYAKADSVLHAKRDLPGAEPRKGTKKAFDPYSKSGDAPKGMRRARKEKPGKSATFKN